MEKTLFVCIQFLNIWRQGGRWQPRRLSERHQGHHASDQQAGHDDDDDIIIAVIIITSLSHSPYNFHPSGEFFAPFHGIWVQLHLAVAPRAYLLQVLVHSTGTSYIIVLPSNTPVQFPEYPLQFPIRSWPKDDDPSFIGNCLSLSLFAPFPWTLFVTYHRPVRSAPLKRGTGVNLQVHFICGAMLIGNFHFNSHFFSLLFFVFSFRSVLILIFTLPFLVLTLIFTFRSILFALQGWRTGWKWVGWTRTEETWSLLQVRRRIVITFKRW